MAEVPKGGRKPIITFLCFARWWSRYQTTRRRDVGLRLKQVFDQADTSNRKVLDKTEFVQLIRVANDDKGLQIGVHWPSGDDIPGSSGSPRRSDAAVKQSAARENCGNPSSSAYSAGQTLENTALDPEQAWEECRKVPLRSEDGHAFHSRSPGSANDSRLGVNFSGFESYWKEQMDIAEPDIPVLPEFMVRLLPRFILQLLLESSAANCTSDRWYRLSYCRLITRYDELATKSRHSVLQTQKLSEMTPTRSEITLTASQGLASVQDALRHGLH